MGSEGVGWGCLSLHMAAGIPESAVEIKGLRMAKLGLSLFGLWIRIFFLESYIDLQSSSA